MTPDLNETREPRGEAELSLVDEARTGAVELALGFWGRDVAIDLIKRLASALDGHEERQRARKAGCLRADGTPKQRFATKAEAESAPVVQPGDWKRAYQCRRCKSWHLGKPNPVIVAEERDVAVATVDRLRCLVTSLRSEAAEAHNEEGWGFEPMAKMKASIADRIDAALGGRSPDAGDAR